MKPDHFFTSHLEPFGEPRTIPGGWDLSGDYTQRPENSNSGESEPASMPGQPQTEAHPESFPKVSTMPKGWDLSDLV